MFVKREVNTVLMKSLDAYMARNKSIASNIANVTTAGYRKREVSFEESLQSALETKPLRGAKTNSRHMQVGSGNIGSVGYEVQRSNNPTLASGVNNVDIDEEMADLAENQIAFKFAMKRLSADYAKINSAISLKPVR